MSSGTWSKVDRCWAEFVLIISFSNPPVTWMSSSGYLFCSPSITHFSGLEPGSYSCSGLCVWRISPGVAPRRPAEQSAPEQDRMSPPPPLSSTSHFEANWLNEPPRYVFRPLKQSLPLYLPPPIPPKIPSPVPTRQTSSLSLTHSLTLSLTLSPTLASSAL